MNPEQDEDAYAMKSEEAFQSFIDDYKDYIYYQNIDNATILALSDSGFFFF